MHRSGTTRDLTRARSEWTYVRSLDVRVHARVWAALPCRELQAPVPVVLVAGLGVSSHYWVPLARRLALAFHVLAPDLPGFGRTRKLPAAPWPGGPNAREQADQLRAWLDARGIDRVALCGHSNGCQVVVDFAMRFPHRVERIVLAAPTYQRGARTLAIQLPRLLLAALFERPSLLPVLAVEYGSAGLIRALQQGVRMLHWPIEDHARHVRAPALVLDGEFDPLVGRSWAKLLASRLPRSMLVEIERVGHAMQYSSPRITADVVRDFLTGRLDVDHAPAEGTIVAPIDHQSDDPLAPPQPITPAVHATLDWAVAAAGIALPRVLGSSRRSRWVFTAAAVANVTNNLLAGHRPGPARRLPMISHVIADTAVGLSVLAAAAISLRRESKPARYAAFALGAYHLLSAALSAKPTGPARVR